MDKQILKDSGYSDEEIAKFMSGNNNANNQNIPNNSNHSIGDRIRKLPPETRQPKRKRKLKRHNNFLNQRKDFLKQRFISVRCHLTHSNLPPYSSNLPPYSIITLIH